jgi:hypothetical protein
MISVVQGQDSGYLTNEDSSRYEYGWQLSYDDVTRDLTVSAQSDIPMAIAELIVVRSNGSKQTFDLVALGILNAGEQVFNVNLKVGVNKGKGILSVAKGQWIPA